MVLDSSSSTASQHAGPRCCYSSRFILLCLKSEDLILYAEDAEDSRLAKLLAMGVGPLLLHADCPGAGLFHFAEGRRRRRRARAAAMLWDYIRRCVIGAVGLRVRRGRRSRSSWGRLCEASLSFGLWLSNDLL